MTIIAPYIYAWSQGNTSFEVSTLDQVAEKTGLRAVTLAFLIDTRWDEIRSWTNAVKSFQGSVILSIGGANGSFASRPGSYKKEAERLIELIDSAGFYGVDFDIEGKVLENDGKCSNLSHIARIVSSHYNNRLYISLTLPVGFDSGLTPAGENVIRRFANDGVPISQINSMTMDYYLPARPSGFKGMGAETVRILNIVNNQICRITGMQRDDAWKKMGVCPMIGLNDDRSVFSLADWETVLRFCYGCRMGLVSFWALNRDQPGNPEDVYMCSGVQRTALEFTGAACRWFK